MQTDADKKLAHAASPSRTLSEEKESEEIRSGAAESHKLDKEMGESPDDFSAAGGKPGLLKGWSVISERSHFHPCRI